MSEVMLKVNDVLRLPQTGDVKVILVNEQRAQVIPLNKRKVEFVTSDDKEINFESSRAINISNQIDNSLIIGHITDENT